MNNPKAKIWLWLIASFVLIGLALFISAGTIAYWQAWVYLGVGAASSVPLQKIIVACSGIPGIAAFVLPGLDHRFGWSSVPPWLSIVGNILIIVAMWMAYRVFRENSFGSATVEIAQDQQVISTGPYAIVRNPMYSSAALYFIGMSLALGSYWGLIPAILTILGLVWRLFDEEKFLAQNLPGYMDYCAKVRWHLILGVFNRAPCPPLPARAAMSPSIAESTP
jgi:protein-S-isoprenylcysteine O-methyltransferase Ste14